MRSPSFFETGQTLIETLVAVFILVMGITAALGLATYSLHSSTNTVRQLVGMGLAREGIEAVKNMRDTNWLQDTMTPNGCYDYVSSTNNAAPCYLNWLNPTGIPGAGGYNINPGAANMLAALRYDPDSSLHPDQSGYYWALESNVGSGLKYDAAAGAGSYYYAPPGGIATGDPDGLGTYYFRQISITRESLAPYNQGSNGTFNRLRVESRVWWQDKDCVLTPSWASASPACKVSLSMFLTNWKNYQ